MYLNSPLSIFIPEHWEAPTQHVIQSRSYRAMITERNNIFQEMKHLQLQKLNRATYRLMPKVDLV